MTEIYHDPFDPEIDRDPHPVWHRMWEEQPDWWNEKYQFFAQQSWPSTCGLPRS